MKHFTFVCCWFFLIALSLAAASYDGPLYDYTAHTKCKLVPEKPLYNGGILKYERLITITTDDGVTKPAFELHNLTQSNIYSFSGWIKIRGAESALIRTRLKTEYTTAASDTCVGTVIAKPGCWSFLKGGFVLQSSSDLSSLFFENSDGRDVKIDIRSASLQPFTEQQWKINQDYQINNVRKRPITIHVSDEQGRILEGAEISIKQVSKDFPIGSAIAKTILGNVPYQKWFTKRFDATVFENELKWYATELTQGDVNYTLPDLMLQFVRQNNLLARGHNIFWEDPKYTPNWALTLTNEDFKKAVNSRIESLLSKYKTEFVHWDVSNEMLHFDLLEQRIGPNATSDFYKTVHASDPLAMLFLNDFNVFETCDDGNSTVDKFILKVNELQRNGVVMNGIGLESHFTVPNVALVRGILDKFATLKLPIWLTEIDISASLGNEKQAIYLEQVLREGYSHPSVNGMMLWSALKPKGCYQMCLTDQNLVNLPAGDVVDKLLQEWQTGELEGKSNEHGSYSFFGFLGEYTVSVKYGERSAHSRFSLYGAHETKHFNILL